MKREKRINYRKMYEDGMYDPKIISTGNYEAIKRGYTSNNIVSDTLTFSKLPHICKAFRIQETGVTYIHKYMSNGLCRIKLYAETDDCTDPYEYDMSDELIATHFLEYDVISTDWGRDIFPIIKEYDAPLCRFKM